jgi:hypothetical protein
MKLSLHLHNVVCLLALLVEGLEALTVPSGAHALLSATAPHTRRADVLRMAIPARWANVHDCERPAKWREALDEEDCKTWRLFQCSSNPDGDGCEIFDEPQDRKPTTKKRKYTDLVPNLETMAEVQAANEAAAERKQIVVLKFYSKSCRACQRIAAKYRRLALDFEDELDCYEIADTPESRHIFDALGVTQVPSVQIFDGSVRLGKFSCMPKEWKVVDAKVRVALLSMTKRRTLHQLFGEKMVDGKLPSEEAKGPATMRVVRPKAAGAKSGAAERKSGLAPPPRSPF